MASSAFAKAILARNLDDAEKTYGACKREDPMENNRTALHVLCSWNRWEAVDGYTPSLSDEDRLVAIAQAMLDSKEWDAVINLHTEYGSTPLMEACQAAFSPRLVRLLLEAGAKAGHVPIPTSQRSQALLQESEWSFFHLSALHVTAVWPRCIPQSKFPNEKYGRISREIEDNLLEITIALTESVADKSAFVDHQVICRPHLSSDSMLEGSTMSGWLYKMPKRKAELNANTNLAGLVKHFAVGSGSWSKRYATLEVHKNSDGFGSTDKETYVLKYRRHKHSTVYSVITNVELVDHHTAEEDQSGSSGGDIRRRSSANYGRTLKRLKKARVGSISEDPNSPPGSPGLAFDAVDRSDQDLQEKELSDFEKTHLFAIRGTFKSKDISYLFSCPSQMELQKWKRKLGNRRGGELINVTPLMLAILSGRNLVANFLIKLSDSQVQDSKKRNATIWAVEYGRTVVAETAAEEWLRQMQQMPFEFHKRKTDIDVKQNPLFQDLAMRVRDFGWDAPFIKSGMLLGLMLCDTRNPMHTANEFAIMCDGNSGDGLTLIWEMLAEQSRSVASGLVGQIPDMAKVALMFKRPVTKRFDITDIVTMVDPRNSSPTRPSVSAGGGGRSKSQGKQPVTAQLMALGYQANNRMMFAQPMVQSYYQERWRHGDDTTHVDQKPAALLGDETERRMNVWLAKMDPAFLRTPRASFWISTLFYVAFLVLLSVVAQETANVVPQFSEATRTIILYAFAWGHVADELMQMIETKRETGTHAAYFGDSGNYVDLIRCVLFILTFILRGYAWLFKVSRFSLAFRAANILFALFIIFCFIHLLSRTVAMNKTIGLQYIMTMRLLGDLLSFIVMLAAMVVSFALAVHKVFIDGAQSDGASLESAASVGTITSTLVNLIFSTFGMFDQKELHTEFSNDFQYSWTTLAMTFFLVVYLIVTAILLMNLLIAAFNDTYMKLNQEAESQLKFAFSRITLEYSSGTVFPSPLNLFHYFFLLIWSIIKAFLNCFGCRKKEPEPAPERPESRASKRASAYQLTTSTDVVTVQMNEMEETEEFMLKVTASCILGYLRASFTTDDSEENHAEVVENLKAISRTVESQG